MKRLVVLQDETLILAELGRLRTARANAEAEDLARGGLRDYVGTIPMSRPPMAVAPPPPRPAAYAIPAPVQPEPVAAVSAMNHLGDGGVNLQELARTAAMGAEKEAIQHALERFRWNRRKTAEYLQVSYKTLLNKMKECGISESPTA